MTQIAARRSAPTSAVFRSLPIYLARKISSNSSGLQARIVRILEFQFAARYGSPERCDRAHPCRPPSMHVVTTITDVDRIPRSNLQSFQREKKGLRTRFVDRRVVHRYEHIHELPQAAKT